MIYLTGVIVTFFLAFLLLGKKGKNVSDKILFCWLIVIGLHLTLYYFGINEWHIKYPYMLGVGFALPLFHGPFLLLYTSALTDQLGKWKYNLLHFSIPFLLMLSITDFFFLSKEEQINVFLNEGSDYSIILSIQSILVKLSGIVYIVWPMALLQKHKRNINNQFSNTDRINLFWLQYLIFGLAFVWFFVFLGNDKLLFLTVVLMVIFMGYFGINQVGIFSTIRFIETNGRAENEPIMIEEINNEIVQDNKNSNKYLKSGLTDIAALDIKHRLHRLMEEDESYKDPDIKLTDLAIKLNINSNQLSQVINTLEGKNFYDYINDWRIKKFISLIEQPDNRKYTVMSLAFDSGFNSKSSFNRYFKKVTSRTPTEYLEALLNSSKK